jgi:nicotinic acid mononucleotide adenylyltransferase/tRNA A-37 threonylcarbamoyl transferase component Bud32
LGHQKVAEEVAKVTGADLVLILPNPINLKKAPLSPEMRLKLIDIALKDSETLVYPLDGKVYENYIKNAKVSGSELFEYIRELNPTAKIEAVIGSDVASRNSSILAIKGQAKYDGWVIAKRDGEIKESFLLKLENNKTYLEDIGDFSSSGAKKYLSENPDIYYKPNLTPDDLPKVLHPDISKYIIENGLYLDYSPSNNKNLLQTVIKKAAVQFRYSFPQLTADIRDFRIYLKKKKNISEFLWNGKKYKVTKKLGQGLFGEAFLLEENGQKFVLKIAYDDKKSIEALQSALPVQRWINEKEVDKIHAPKLLASSPEGNWAISEFIEGITIEKYLKTTVNPDPTIIEEVRKLHEECIKFAKIRGIQLDFAADNIVIKEGKAVLVDLGPLANSKIPEDFQKVLGIWKTRFAVEDVKPKICVQQLLEKILGSSQAVKN